MSFFRRLLGKFGYVKLEDHGLFLSEDGRVVSAYPTPARQLTGRASSDIEETAKQLFSRKPQTQPPEVTDAPTAQGSSRFNAREKEQPSKNAKHRETVIGMASPFARSISADDEINENGETAPASNQNNREILKAIAAHSEETQPVAKRTTGEEVVSAPASSLRAQGSEGLLGEEERTQGKSSRRGEDGAIGRKARNSQVVLGKVSKEKNSSEKTQMLDVSELVELREPGKKEANLDATRIDLLLPDF